MALNSNSNWTTAITFISRNITKRKLSNLDKNRKNKIKCPTFDEYIGILLDILQTYGNNVLKNDGFMCYSYPKNILLEMIDYCLQYCFETQHESVTLTENNSIVKVSSHSIGTSVVNMDICFNGIYLFEFKYIKGTHMDSILGVVDNQFILSEEGNGVGNQINCFNWGLRYDGIVCFDNKTKLWKKDTKYKWNNNDIILMRIDTKSLFDVQFYINKKHIYSDKILKSIKYNQYPLKIAVSNARDGGFILLKGAKVA